MRLERDLEPLPSGLFAPSDPSGSITLFPYLSSPHSAPYLFACALQLFDEEPYLEDLMEYLGGVEVRLVWNHMARVWKVVVSSISVSLGTPHVASLCR